MLRRPGQASAAQASLLKAGWTYGLPQQQRPVVMGSRFRGNDDEGECALRKGAPRLLRYLSRNGRREQLRRCRSGGGGGQNLQLVAGADAILCGVLPIDASCKAADVERRQRQTEVAIARRPMQRARGHRWRSYPRQRPTGCRPTASDSPKPRRRQAAVASGPGIVFASGPGFVPAEEPMVTPPPAHWTDCSSGRPGSSSCRRSHRRG